MMVFGATEKRNVVGQKKNTFARERHASSTRRKEERERKRGAFRQRRHTSHTFSGGTKTNRRYDDAHARLPSRPSQNLLLRVPRGRHAQFSRDRVPARKKKTKVFFVLLVLLSHVCLSFSRNNKRALFHEREKKATKKRICLFILL